jgi:hypothetical protein
LYYKIILIRRNKAVIGSTQIHLNIAMRTAT